MSQLLESLASKEGLEKSDVLYYYLKGKAWEAGTPISGLFELTPRCTLDCVMCYVHLFKNQMRKPELTTEQWMSLIDEACDAGMLFATLTGGECLLYPGFRQIYEHLQSKGVLVTILTNGTLLDEDMVNWLSERSPQRVQLSLYGSSPEGCGRVTGAPEAFYKVDKAIDLLKMANIPLDVTITLSKQMLPDFESILRYCEKKGISNFHVNSCPFDSREETQRSIDNFAPCLEDQIGSVRILKKVFEKKYGQEFFENLAHEAEKRANNGSTMPKKGVPCSAGRNSFSINWEGKMIPCSIFDFSGQFPLIEGFQNAWIKLNSKCVEYNNPVECIGCTYFGTCRSCPAGHFLKVGEGHANPEVCAEGKRMVGEKLRF